VKEITDEHIIALMRSPTEYERGFKLLMQHYQERIYWQVRRMLNDHEDSNDVVQNIFIKVFRGFATFEEKSKLSTWLYRIAINETMTFLQKKQQKTTDSMDNVAMLHSIKADSYFDGNHIQQMLKDAIAQLPEKQRIVFNLRYYDEMPYDEMSSILATSVGALKASFHHAVKKIEDYIKQHEL
jgi:RNA polymerase sigma factor (sigma-70 family)